MAFPRVAPSTAAIGFGAVLLLLPAAGALLAPWIAPFAPDETDLLNMLQPPSFAGPHYFGTDDLGRDILSRILYGARPVFIVGGAASVLGLVIGAWFGLLAGYLGGRTEAVLSRLAEVQLTIPGLSIALLAVALFGSDMRNLVLILAFESWPLHYRVVRERAVVISRTAYVEAARIAHVSGPRILIRHVLPGVAPVLASTWAISTSLIIMTEAGLSFMGLGIQPPTADWGLMIAQGKSQLAGAWWLSILPGIALVWLLSGVQILSDGFTQRLSHRDPA